MPDAGEVIRQSNAGQTAATIKRIGPNACNTIRNGDAGQAAATIKRIITEAVDAGRNGDAGQTAATLKRIAPDAGDAAGNGDTSQATATIKHRVPDAGNGARYRDTRNSCFVSKRIGADAGDGQTPDSRWNDYIIVSTRIPGDGNSAIACRKVKTSNCCNIYRHLHCAGRSQHTIIGFNGKGIKSATIICRNPDQRFACGKKCSARNNRNAILG